MSCLMINDIDAGIGRFCESPVLLVHWPHTVFTSPGLTQLAAHGTVRRARGRVAPYTISRSVTSFPPVVLPPPIPSLASPPLPPAHTQTTVNNQMVVGTLMNLCDHPTRVSIGQDWREADVVNRVPIIVTGNDFSTLWAPLIRDGRMDKFYW